MTEQDIARYWASLTQEEKFKAFCALAFWSAEISDIRYDEKSNRIYWDSDGKDIKD